MCKFDLFQHIINSSKQFYFEFNTILVIQDYNTGKKIKLDLSLMNEESFEDMLVEDVDDEE